MKIEPGDIVIAIMHSPREKLLGTMNEINPAGISIRSIELGYFDDWCKAISSGEIHLQMTDNFLPMWRVERITRDEATDDVPSMSDQFHARTGGWLTDQ